MKTGMRQDAISNGKKTKVSGFALCTLLFALSSPVEAQQAKKIPHIGVLYPGLSRSPTRRWTDSAKDCVILALRRDKTSPSSTGSRRESLIGCLISRLSWSVLRLTSSWPWGVRRRS